MATRQWAIEVPLCQFDACHTLDVPGDGTPRFALPVLPEGDACAGKSKVYQGSIASRCLVWQLDAAKPAQLLLRDVGVSEERREGSVCLSFASSLLPCVSCTESVQHGGTLVAVVTADGMLHTIRHSTGAAASTGSLASQLRAPGAMASVSLAAHFQRAGPPTAVLEVGGFICVGTSEGNLVCLPATSTDLADAFPLAPMSSLGKMFGGFFGRAVAGQAIVQLQELTFLDSRLLAAIQADGQLHFWHLPSRQLVHTAELRPNHMSEQWVPSVARLTAEPLDASTSILLVYFEPRDQASPEPCVLQTYEVFVEQRGEGLYKIAVEGGPKLQARGAGGRFHRVRDLVLENLALHTVGAWLLYDDAAGKRSVDCVALAFQSGPPDTETLVQLVEAQLVEGCGAAEELQLQQQVWQCVEDKLAQPSDSGTAAGGLTPAAVAAAFADAVIAPGRLSRPALHAALVQLGSQLELEEVQQPDLGSLQELLPGWVAAAPHLPAAAASSGGSTAARGSAAVLAQWTAFLQAYAAAWAQQHRPIALLQLPPQAEQRSMLLARQGGMFTSLRGAVAPEIALHQALPPIWHRMAAEEALEAEEVLRAAAAVNAAAGGQLGRLAWACLQQGMDADAVVLPALVAALVRGTARATAAGGSSGGGRTSFLSGGGGGGSDASIKWRAACRRLPLQLGHLWASGDPGVFAAAVASALKVLGSDWHDCTKLRSPMAAASRPVSWAQVEAVLQLALLQRYVLWHQTLGLWTISPEDCQQLQTQLLPRTMELLRAAAVAYWTAVTPTAEVAADGGSTSPALDPSEMVVSLRIHDGPAAGPAAVKRMRLSLARNSYAAVLMLAANMGTNDSHVVRDLPDLQRVALLFTQRLLCLSHSPIHTGGRQLQQGPNEKRIDTVDPADVAVQVAAGLFAGRHTAQLAALQRLLPATVQDMRLLFFKACSRAREIALTASPEQQQQLEEDSCSLFFRVSAVFSPTGAASGQAAAVRSCVQQLLADGHQEPLEEDASLQAAGLAYFEALVALYERLGRYSAAARFALAATRQVAAALPAQEQLAARAQAQGRLWATAFGYCMECARYEEAYVVLLSIEVADLQLDCMQRLVSGLCAAPGGLELLCRLPFAHNLAVLADFHISRNNYQAAAGALLAYARRLVGEHPDDSTQLAEAEHALAAAVSCLSLVERQHAWIPDPAAADQAADEDSDPPVLTVAALRREYAVVRAHATLAAATPGSRQGTALLTAAGAGVSGEALRGADAEDVFTKLLVVGEHKLVGSEGLHDAAFQLAEAAFCGTQLTRALERAFASLAAECMRQQLAVGRAPGSADAVPSSAAAEAGGEDGMDTEEAGRSAAGGGASLAARGSGGGGGGAQLASWQRLKEWLQRHEGGEHRFRLRLVILDALLQIEPDIMLPPWIMAAFQAKAGPAGNGGDLGGALRVLLRHGRLADAAQLAGQHLQHILHSVPSVAMSRTSQVYFPQALLDELLSRLDGGDAGNGDGDAGNGDGGAAEELAPERRRLAELLQRVRSSALSQTAVTQELFAH
ncbi:Nuclear pore complex protein NUP160 [Chlorella vulgaris]